MSNNSRSIFQSKLASIFLKDTVKVEPEWQTLLGELGLTSVADFMELSTGSIVSRATKQAVQKIEINHSGTDYCFYIKQQRVLTLKRWVKMIRRPKTTMLACTREYQLLKLCREKDIAVMPTVAWGERRLFAWPTSGFLLVQSVPGSEFNEAYKKASARCQRRMMYSYGALVGGMHQSRINSKVRPRDIICQKHDGTGCNDQLVLIDRERGKPRPVTMEPELAIKQIVDGWQKNAGYIDYPEVKRLLCYWAGYCSQRPEYRSILRNKKELFLEIYAGLVPQPDRNLFNQHYEQWMKQ